MKFATKAIHVGEEPNFKEGGSGDVVVPIHLSSTFARKDVDKPTGGYEYSRSGNPTRDALEKRLAALENAKYGLAFSSGLGAETTLLLSLLKKGDHIIGFDDLYGGTKRLFQRTMAGFGLEFTFVDASHTANVEDAIRENTRLIWLESPTNPLMKLCDIREISKIAKRHGILTVVDNTFMSPFFQNPLGLGADIVLHSTTKYISGHSDVVGGAIMLSDEDIYRKIKFNQNAIGTVPSPFDCYLTLRGIKTLALRMERHDQNGRRVAEYLESHPKVKKVNYPGLKSFPQHELAKRQMTGFGGMLSFELDADLAQTKRVLERFRIYALAESLGGVESLVEHPALMTHASIPREDREKIGITDSLVRLSTGIEDIDDLIGDLDYALGAI
ncbi:cystathionine gamma-lyase [Methanocella conradii HZ254]|uniref:Cystathionine gamma-lyase n=1 Tax=Methanocella conradii (strain DSM 24694 / JCM 17849 / CGMCC 1.5162 / HZ254) TaxID=1041930 RepID=H8I7V7_METCZ|nr:PLP-dependent aspartate aminotransferase family protein [Methanocella conradii]AFD00357.1 cystathionine gamma-lyase [Methanocella conradii HZ254]MDI6895833.1 PLP-dependent aspartate aminotransferase family protein [Methanocella conradii]